jgi:uncharacterized coiled-coil protein SlyX
MDLSTMTDLNELKAMAYDQVVALEQTQNNLRIINQRIEEVKNEEAPTPKK